MTALDTDTQNTASGRGRFARLLRVFIPIFLLVVGLVALNAVLDIRGLLSSLLGGEGARQQISVSNRYYFPLEDVLVSLRREDGTPVFLNMSITLELTKPQDQEQIERILPSIQDSIQVFLREVHFEELEGSEGIYRLREELLFRVNRLTAPVYVQDVLFNNIITQ